MNETILELGCLMAAGVAGAIAASRVKLPYATGAMAFGFAAAAILPDSRASLSLAPLLTALLCFCLGASLEPGTLLKKRGGQVGMTALVLLAVTMAAGATTLAIGLPWRATLAIGLAMVAALPIPIVAVTTSERARGKMTQRILAAAPLSILGAALIASLLTLEGRTLLPFLALTIGSLCGAVTLVPLSRLTRRAGIISAVLLAASLLTLAVARLGPLAGGEAGLAIASITAGFIAVNFIPNRPIVREALRDLAVPASVIWAALRGGMGVEPAAAQAISVAVAATLLSAMIGMPLAAFALRRASETAGDENDPDAWRGPMR